MKPYNHLSGNFQECNITGVIFVRKKSVENWQEKKI